MKKKCLENCLLMVLATIKITSNHVIIQRIGSVSFQLTKASFHLKKGKKKKEELKTFTADQSACYKILYNE